MSEFNLREHLDLTEEVVPLVRRWVAEAARHKVEGSASLLAGVLRDPNGLASPSASSTASCARRTSVVAARNLAELAPHAPALPALVPEGRRPPRRRRSRPVLPQVVVPDRPPGAARAWSATSSSTPPTRRLGAAIAKHPRSAGVRLNVNLLGEAVLGERGGRAPPRRHPRAARARRRRLRLDQGLLDRRPAQPVGASTRPSTTSSSALAAAVPQRRGQAPAASSSTSTWRSTRTSTSRSRSSPGILDRPEFARPRGRHRAAGLPARRPRPR